MTFDEFNSLGVRPITAEKINENYKINNWNAQFLYQAYNPDNM